MMDWATLIRIHPSPVQTSHAYPSSSLVVSWLMEDKHGYSFKISSLFSSSILTTEALCQIKTQPRDYLQSSFGFMVITKEPNWRLRRSALTLRCTFHPNRCSEHARNTLAELSTYTQHTRHEYLSETMLTFIVLVCLSASTLRCTFHPNQCLEHAHFFSKKHTRPGVNKKQIGHSNAPHLKKKCTNT